MTNTSKIIEIDKVRQTFFKLGNFSERELTILIDNLKTIAISKDDFLIREGAVCKSVFFVEKGSFRNYRINELGEEITQNLYLEGDCVLDYKSFTSQKPTSSAIQAVEDSNLWELTINDLHKLMKTSDAFFQVGRIFQFGIEQQEIQLQNTTPKERYLYLLTNKPQLKQRFPLKFIASYLGMTPETLSRVRKSLSL